MFRLIGALLLTLSVMTPVQAREWQRAELPGVVLYSDGYPHELQRWALKLQLFDALLRKQSGVAASDAQSGSPLTIYLLDEGKDIERLTGRENLNGFYSPSSEGSFLLASRAPAYHKDRMSGQISLFHEYTHHFMYRHFASAWPAWYREGFAEYASAITFDVDRTARLGLPNWPRLEHIDRAPMPIEQILKASVDEFKPDDKARFYAWSWQLVHLLMSSPEDRSRLDRYLSLYSSGLDPIVAARAAFGDLSGLQGRMLSHAADPRGSAVIPVDIGNNAEVPVTALSPEDSRLIDVRLMRIAGGDQKAALKAVQAFVTAYPSNPQGRLELALALKDSNPSEARTSALTAMSLAPGDARALAIWSEIAFRQLKSNPASMPEDWDKIRSQLVAAIGPDTRDPMVLSSLFRSYLAEPRKPTAQAVAAMDEALTLQPESYELRSLGVYSFALQGRDRDAQRTARILASDPHSGSLGTRALEVLERIEQRRVRAN
ncbi:MAG: hypothetical protein KDE32_11030 [Novosphingobium sp.]|nr:hypothetical protein [Novosphingobium sp.]